MGCKILEKKKSGAKYRKKSTKLKMKDNRIKRIQRIKRIKR
jgi:hypothetical protein